MGQYRKAHLFVYLTQPIQFSFFSGSHWLEGRSSPHGHGPWDSLPAASVPIHTNLAPLTIHSVLPLFMLIFLKYRLDFRNYISKREKKKNCDSTRIICSEILYHDFFTGQFYQIFRKYKTWNALDFMVYLLFLQRAYLVALGTSIFCKQSYFSCYCHVVFLCIKTIILLLKPLKNILKKYGN